MALGAMAMIGYSTYPKAPTSLEPHYQIIEYYIQDTHWGGVLPLWKEAVGVFYSLSRLGNTWKEDNLIHTFPKGISIQWNTICHVSDLKPSPLPTTITVIPWTPLPLHQQYFQLFKKYNNIIKISVPSNYPSCICCVAITSFWLFCFYGLYQADFLYGRVI